MGNTAYWPQGALETLILKALPPRPLHGYGIPPSIQQIYGERLEVLQRSFCTANDRLERRGGLRGQWGESESHRKARFYRRTNSGKRQLKEETENWIDLARDVVNILPAKAERT
jgi:DNA-binding PadR family transcriptional regulator